MYKLFHKNLNDKIRKNILISCHVQTAHINGLKLPSVPSYQHMKAMKYETANQLSSGEFLFEISRYLMEDTPKAINFMKTQSKALNKLYLNLLPVVLIIV